MNASALIMAVLFAAVALVVVWQYQTWTVSRFVSTLPAAFHLKRPASRPTLESQYIVELTSDVVRCTDPSGTVESLEWRGLRKVELVTTDEGPFLPDLFWVLHDLNAECVVIPLGATGDDALLKRLQDLPGFRNEVFTQAMCLTSNNRFVCWEAAQPFASN